MNRIDTEYSDTLITSCFSCNKNLVGAYLVLIHDFEIHLCLECVDELFAEVHALICEKDVTGVCRCFEEAV